MSVFLYHPQNTVSVKLKEAYDEDGFIYRTRPEMEQIIKKKLLDTGVELWTDYYLHLGSMSTLSLHNTINKYIELDPDNNMHKQILNSFKQKQAWAYVKLNNGPNMKCVIGYCNSDPTTPFLMSAANMAQSGIINTTFVPR